MMLEELHVRDLALIEDAWLSFGPGMTVLTGETGAGKTVLMGALKLLLGERADSQLVRAGADEALVEGRFVLAGDDVIVRRRVGADGRSRCSLGDEMATVGALAERVGPLVDLHGQHEHQALLTVATHVGYLDGWAGDEAAAALVAYRAALAGWRSARDRADELRARVERARAESENLHYVVAEIERVGPRPNEDEELRQRLPSLEHAERLRGAAEDAARALRGDAGALDRIAEAASALERVRGIDPDLDEMALRLGDLQAVIDDVGVSMRAYRDRVEHDPMALDEVQSRLNALAGLVRRFGPTLADVLNTRDEALATLEAADSGAESLTSAEAECEERRRELEEAGRALSRVRAAASPGFCQALGDATEDLAMGGARFEVRVSQLDFESWTQDGPERVEFLYAPAAGQPARPLSRIASGGELSRVMLALKSVLGTADTVGTLVFDEVDAGIGGTTAIAVGMRLASLARSHQVIVVTHLAQVAAFADAHLVVRKVDDGAATVTTVVPVEGADRVDEIARMLSGEISAASRTHAVELLERSATGAASPAA